MPHRPSMGEGKKGHLGGAHPCEWYLHKEGHQLDEGLFLGIGGKLGDHLDDFVHDIAQIVLELLPSFLHKLGILRKQRDRSAQVCFPSLSINCPSGHTMINHYGPGS